MRVLKVKCPECGAKAIIKKTNPKHPHISDIYCACSDVECGHTFVLNLTFKPQRQNRGLDGANDP